MKRWVGALIVTLLGCVLIFLQRSSDPGLLQDTDTRVLLATIRERHAPFSWFTGDWPLGNHFYRPISTLAFELDNRLYGSAAWGYGLTNALLCVACTLLLFWYLRELTDRPLLTGASTFIFVCWQTGETFWLIQAAQIVALAAIVGGLIRHRLKVRNWLPAAFVAYEVAIQLRIAQPLSYRVIGWLPGRTASVMALFALAALATYARYERLSAERRLPDPTPLDPPATRSTTQAKATHRGVWIWPILSIFCTALALGAYEQAVMLPAILLATACTMRWQGYRVRWGWQAAFWSALVGYMALRHAFVPSDPSHYQLQQFRKGPGVWISLSGYTIPSVFTLMTASAWVSSLPISLFTDAPWLALLEVATDVTTFVQARRRWVLAFAGLGMSFLAFLPMAWVKQFEHYHYWPLALRSLFVAVLAWIALELTANAWSPQTRQAPPRPDPAPGSLPRP
ncbi:hypothetical protein [Fimbriimonas ginsengisoli]|uniref:hypothetical protein n=1 Tax=Fimbriimonas ginsengisoli TaxID=1005039 RepID=UPI00046D80C0|nr:hypothetical protein [Fimbriimonas ginsengisoli]